MAVKDQLHTDNYSLYNGDCCEVMLTLPDESIDLSIYSPPFGGLYNYSSDDCDMSNCNSESEFFEHYEFLVEQIHRVTKKGRTTAVHCTDIRIDGANIAGIKDFPGEIIKLHQKLGFDYWCRRCVWKEPLTVRNRTMSKALAHKTIIDDSSLTNIAHPDYLIQFRKKGENPEPVTHPTGLMSYAGEREVPHEFSHWRGYEGDQKKNRYSHWIWRQYASAFWDDVRLDRILPYKESKDEQDERHQHPLQLDTIERGVVLWSNPGDVVLTPFMGVGSEAYGAVLNGRKAIGIELKESYYKQAIRNLKTIKIEDETDDLLSGIEDTVNA